MEHYIGTIVPIWQSLVIRSLLEFHLFLFVSFHLLLILIQCSFYYFVMCKCMNTIFRVNGTVQFPFFLVMVLNITTVASCDSWNGLKKHVRNVADIKYGIVKSVAINFTLYKRSLFTRFWTYSHLVKKIAFFVHCILLVVSLQTSNFAILGEILTRTLIITKECWPQKETQNWLLTKQLLFQSQVKFSNRITRKRCEICSKFTIKTPEQYH